MVSLTVFIRVCRCLSESVDVCRCLSMFVSVWPNLSVFDRLVPNLTRLVPNLTRIDPNWPEIDENLLEIDENLLEIDEIHENLLEIDEIHENSWKLMILVHFVDPEVVHGVPPWSAPSPYHPITRVPTHRTLAHVVLVSGACYVSQWFWRVHQAPFTSNTSSSCAVH